MTHMSLKAASDRVNELIAIRGIVVIISPTEGTLFLFGRARAGETHVTEALIPRSLNRMPGRHDGGRLWRFVRNRAVTFVIDGFDLRVNTCVEYSDVNLDDMHASFLDAMAKAGACSLFTTRYEDPEN